MHLTDVPIDGTHLFTAEELVSVAELALQSQRLPDNLSVRTLRYYISQGLIPKPIGPTRNARYDQDHLRRLLAIRVMQSKGKSLEQIKFELEQGADLNQMAIEAVVEQYRASGLLGKPAANAKGKSTGDRFQDQHEQVPEPPQSSGRPRTRTHSLRLPDGTELIIPAASFNRRGIQQILAELEALLAAWD